MKKDTNFFHLSRNKPAMDHQKDSAALQRRWQVATDD